jgi:hypothetical protein
MKRTNQNAVTNQQIASNLQLSVRAQLMVRRRNGNVLIVENRLNTVSMGSSIAIAN